MKAIEAFGTVAEELGEWINSELELFRTWGEQVEVILHAAFIAFAFGFALGAILSK